MQLTLQIASILDLLQTCVAGTMIPDPNRSPCCKYTIPVSMPCRSCSNAKRRETCFGVVFGDRCQEKGGANDETSSKWTAPSLALTLVLFFLLLFLFSPLLFLFLSIPSPFLSVLVCFQRITCPNLLAVSKKR